MGQTCGSCFCPPTYTAGDCAPGLECQHNPTIPDAPGKCVLPIFSNFNIYILFYFLRIVKFYFKFTDYGN